MGYFQSDITRVCQQWSYVSLVISHWYVEGLAQDCSNSIANALELSQSCTKPSMRCIIQMILVSMWDTPICTSPYFFPIKCASVNLQLKTPVKFSVDLFILKQNINCFLELSFHTLVLTSQGCAIHIYRKVFNIRRTLVGNKIVDHSDVVGAPPVGAAPTTSSFST